MQGTFSRIRASKLARNVAALYTVHAVNYILPLVVTPFLVRVLKPEGWGLVAFAQSFGQVLSLVIEYGFNLSATRDIAARRDDRDYLARALSSVLLAKCLLSGAAILAALVVQAVVPALGAHPLVLWSATLWAIAQGMSMVWFYQGLEQLQFISRVEVASKAAGAVLILAIIRRPEQGWLVLALFAATSAAGAAFAFVTALRDYGLHRPAPKDAVEALRSGLGMFLFRGSVALYTSANAFILGLFAGPSAAGIYAAAERISKAFLGLMNPVSQALYPRINSLVARSLNEAASLARKATYLVMSAAGALALLVLAGARAIVRILLGPEFADAVFVLRLLAALIPLIAASNLLGMQWMLPLRRDAAFNRVIITAGLINIALACILAPGLQAPGMALAVIVSEAYVTFACLYYLHTQSISPFSRDFFPPSERIPA